MSGATGDDQQRQAESIRQTFVAFEKMALALADLGSSSLPGFDQYLDNVLASGAFVRIEVGIGKAGCLSLIFSSLAPDGEVRELLSIPAPPRDAAFSFSDGIRQMRLPPTARPPAHGDGRRDDAR